MCFPLLARWALAVSALAVAFCLPSADAAVGCDLYASPAGSDRQAGTAEAPFRNAQRLVDALRPGQTGCLRAGTYTRTEHGYIARFGSSGRAGAPITLRSAPGERARLVGIVMVAAGANHVRLLDLDIEGTGRHNSVKVYAADTLIAGNDITNKMRGDSCMMLGSAGYGRARRTIVRDNHIHDCGAVRHGNQDHAIYSAASDDVQIVDNSFSNAAGYTLQLYPDTRGAHVAGNVINGGRDSVRGGIVIGGTGRSASRNNVIEHNVIAFTATAGVTAYWDGRRGSGNVVRDNCTWSTADGAIGVARGLLARGNVAGDPGFADRARGDLRLAPGSPCQALLRR